MNRTTVIGVGVLVGVVAGLWLTRPAVEPPPPESTDATPPWEHGMAEHMAEHGVRIGPTPDSDLVVTEKDGKIHVVMSFGFLSEHGEELLPALGMTGPEAVLSEEGWSEFLESLHMTLFEHEHDHEHGQDEHDHHPDHAADHDH